ncbi:hypothetical protein ACIPRD_12180 [Streptomyces sp. NPDC090108]|uniref:hypothetical protein n=1 Tax=Streptomyces sp. NPDC090108 TaxID=3365947 RepID=UPI00381B8C8D
MTDRHADVLAMLSWNKAAPGSVLMRLLKYDDRAIRRTIAQRGNLPTELVEAILMDPDPALRMEFALSENADPAQRARLLDDPFPRVALALAVGPTPYRRRVEPLPDWAYERLLSHPQERVRRETATSHLVPAHLLAGLAHHPDGTLRQASCRAWDRLQEATRQALLEDDDPDVRRVAALRVCHQDEALTTWLVEHLQDSWKLSDVLRAGRLSHELAERMADGPRAAALAANPFLSPGLVRRLALSPDPRVRLVVSARPELAESERAAIDYTVEPDARLDPLEWVWEARDDADVLRRCATSAHPWLRRSAAVCPTLPADLVELLAQDEDFAVRLLLCEFHPEPPPELLLDLYLNGSHRAVKMLITRPSFPSAGLAARFADSTDPERRSLALRDPALSPDLLVRFTHQPDLRRAAARHPRLPVPRIRELLKDPGTAGAAAGNPSLPSEDMHRLLDDAGVPA